MRRTIAGLLPALAVALSPAAARADRRYYGETYTAQTAPRGSLDLELWSTFHQAPRNSGEPDVWRHQVELETGITDRWDVALYNIARNVDGQGLEYEALKVETRYKLAETGKWFVDPVLYFEAQKTFVDDRPWSIEEKLILSKDIGALNLAVNLAAEQEFVGGNVNHDFDWATCASWEIVPAFRVGAEAFGVVARDVVEGGGVKVESSAWAGPAVSVAYGRAWLVLAAGFALTDVSEALRARAIFAWQF